MERFSFKKGFMQVKQKDAPAAKREIMNAIGITTRVAWATRLNGKVEPRISEAESIAEILSKYGVNGEIWGE